VNFHTGVSFLKARHKQCEKVLNHLSWSTNAERSRMAPFERKRALAERGGVCQQATTAFKHILAFWSQVNAPADPVEQGNAELSFESQYLSGGSRLAQIDPNCCSG
jgi:hypothetical protein